MEKSSSGRNETNQKLFDSYCKRILKNEAIDCFREIQKHRQREIFFSELSEKEWKQLYMEDEYDLDTCNFQEIAKLLNLRQSTIHYHRTSSLKSLKEFLEERTNED